MRKTRRNNKRSNRLDIKTVAKAAKVSVATVSRVTNNIRTVDPAIAKRVWQTISDLGYVPNTQARALASGRSNFFGVIISEITNPFFPELIRGFEEKAGSFGYETLIGSTNYDLQQMEQCVQRMLERKVDGVAVMTFGIEEPLIDRLASQGIPMVFIDAAPKREGISAIQIDYKHGINEAVQHLAVLGHRRIGFISGPKGQHSPDERAKMFRSAMTSIGLTLPTEYVYIGDHTVEGGARGAEHLLKLKSPPTAIMCSNDMSAIGAMHGVSRLGLKIPGDISLIGFDDIHIAQYTLPPLTTVRMSGREIASAAVTALKASIDGGKQDGIQNLTVETRLVVRQSTTVPVGSLSDLQAKKRVRRRA
jgi:DNA-binding LacI/PurR family transcriptional regulator